MKIIFDYANYLSGRGHDINIYVPSVSYDYEIGAPDFRPNVRTILRTIKNYTRSFSRFFDVRNIKISIVPVLNNYFIRDAYLSIATAWPTAYSLYNLNPGKGTKVYLIQDYEIWNSNIDKVDYSYRMSLERITISNYLHDFMKEKFGSDSTVILNGLDFSLLNNPGKDYTKREKTISFINYENSRKNVETCLEAVKAIKDKYDNLKFISFGLEKYHNLPGYIKFYKCPSEEKISEIYRETDIFLFLSRNEGFALPPAEAMACKCAVVTTKVGAVPEYSTDNESAIFVSPADIKDITDAVKSLINDNNKLKQISEKGYTTVRSKLDWNNSIDKFEKTFLI
ncbi:MAG: glycosyltransferase family 4 protein [Bacteroidetes bacterium]|nr:glycosyltransferase family 4 protein [Bacteroidota bacterium]